MVRAVAGKSGGNQHCSEWQLQTAPPHTTPQELPQLSCAAQVADVIVQGTASGGEGRINPVCFQNPPSFTTARPGGWGPPACSWLRGGGLAFPVLWLLCLSRAVGEEVVAMASGTAGGDDGGASGRPLTKAQPGHRSYNLQERRRIGSMTGVEQALLPRVPTDESEAQTLATADLDLMKSKCWAWAKPSACGNRVKRKGEPDPALPPPGHRFEDVPGVRRHLVRKNAKGSGQSGREGREPGPTPRGRPRAPHKPHEVRFLASRVSFFSPPPLPLPLGPAAIAPSPGAPAVLGDVSFHTVRVCHEVPVGPLD